MGRDASEKIKYLTQQEASRLFNSIKNSRGIHSIRDLAIFRVAYRCGLRASEIALLRLEDYNISKGRFIANDLKEVKIIL